MGDRTVVIGASLSGIDALSRLVGALPANFPAPILIAQHVAPHSPGLLPHILSGAGPLQASHPQQAETLKAGHIYVAPPDRHMLLEKGYVRLSHGPHENLARPAIDPLFRSAALAYGPAVIGIVLTGQLDDGTAGLLAIKDRGGTVMVQEPSEATAPSMPLSALAHVTVDHRSRLADMAKILIELAWDAPSPPQGSPSGSLLDTENRIASGVFSVEDWWHLEPASQPSGLNCPTCRSALYELNDSRLLRYRCRAGHAFSARSLLSGQADAREDQLSSLSAPSSRKRPWPSDCATIPTMRPILTSPADSPPGFKTWRWKAHKSASGCTPWPVSSNRSRRRARQDRRTYKAHAL